MLYFNGKTKRNLIVDITFDSLWLCVSLVSPILFIKYHTLSINKPTEYF